MSENCIHAWGHIFCTHLGHESLGAHSVHRICYHCGSLWSLNLGIREESIRPANKVMQYITYWDIIREDHTCRSGWRGIVIAEVFNEERQKLMPSTPKEVHAL